MRKARRKEARKEDEGRKEGREVEEGKQMKEGRKIPDGRKEDDGRKEEEGRKKTRRKEGEGCGKRQMSSMSALRPSLFISPAPPPSSNFLQPPTFCR